MGHSQSLWGRLAKAKISKGRARQSLDISFGPVRPQACGFVHQGASSNRRVYGTEFGVPIWENAK